jgi:hypothetical protein
VVKVVGVLAVALAAEAALAHPGAGKEPAAPCAATTVRYQAAQQDAPWVLARPAARGVRGFVVSYPETLRDGRVNRSDGLGLWQAGARIVWAGVPSGVTVLARRLDGPGSLRLSGRVSEPRFPSAGCWRLSVGGASVVTRVVSRPTTPSCDATPLRPAGAFARPLSSGIRGGWGPWRTPAGGALLYTHGHGAGLNMKVPWWVDGGGGSIDLVGKRLDAEGSFRQTFQMAGSPQGVYPSIVDIPATGCWLLRLRTGRLAGVLVVQAVDDRG